METRGATPAGLLHSVVSSQARPRATRSERYRRHLAQARTAEEQRAEKLPQDGHLKLSSVISDIHGVSGRDMLDAIAAGRRDPKALAQLARGTMGGNSAAFCQSFTQFATNQAGQVTGMTVDGEPVAGRIATAPAATSDGLTISSVIAYRITGEDVVEVAFKLTDSSYRPEFTNPSLLASLNGASGAASQDALPAYLAPGDSLYAVAGVRHHPAHRAVLPAVKRPVRVAALHHIDQGLIPGGARREGPDVRLVLEYVRLKVVLIQRE